jgi:hypothetical protein
VSSFHACHPSGELIGPKVPLAPNGGGEGWLAELAAGVEESLCALVADPVPVELVATVWFAKLD